MRRPGDRHPRPAGGDTARAWPAWRQRSGSTSKAGCCRAAAHRQASSVCRIALHAIRLSSPYMIFDPGVRDGRTQPVFIKTIGPVDRPAGAGYAPRADPPSAEFVADHRQQPRSRSHLSICFVARLDPAQRHDPAQVTQGQPDMPPMGQHENDDVAAQATPAQHVGSALRCSANACAARSANRLSSTRHRRRSASRGVSSLISRIAADPG